MAQLGFFDADKRLEALSAKGDPLEAIDRLVPWESFRAEIEAVMLTPDELKKSSAGRKPFDAILMFRMLVLQALNNLSDEQVEYQVRDRLSFSRFLGLAIEDSIPDATTLWLFREKLAEAGLIEKLFERFDQHLAAKGYIARGGQIIDASIVPVPTQRNSRDENDQLRAGRTPAGWKQKPAKLRQKDRDARWTKKHGRSFFGYKNHVNADAKHKLIRHYAVTDAAVHDSQELDGLLDKGNTCNDVFADSAYRSAKIESKLRASGYNSRIHRRGRRNHPLSLAQMRVNYAKSRIRARIEHVFGAQQNDFFTMSECRDLLFHVQEHQLTLPQIAAFVDDNALTFIGFDVNAATRALYRARFPADAEMKDVSTWHLFERENPDTFVGMYQFWVQKA
jgi:IS5 family transposase